MATIPFEKAEFIIKRNRSEFTDEHLSYLFKTHRDVFWNIKRNFLGGFFDHCVKELTGPIEVVDVTNDDRFIRLKLMVPTNYGTYNLDDVTVQINVDTRIDWAFWKADEDPYYHGSLKLKVLSLLCDILALKGQEESINLFEFDSIKNLPENPLFQRVKLYLIDAEYCAETGKFTVSLEVQTRRENCGIGSEHYYSKSVILKAELLEEYEAFKFVSLNF